MKKILGLLCLLSIFMASAAYAADETTYTEKFINKHASKIINKEKQLTAQQKAQKEKYEAQQKAQKEKYEAQKKAAQKRQEESKKKVEKKKKAWKELTTF